VWWGAGRGLDSCAVAYAHRQSGLAHLRAGDAFAKALAGPASRAVGPRGERVQAAHSDAGADRQRAVGRGGPNRVINFSREWWIQGDLLGGRLTTVS
jgi:hypothetical protein